MLVQGQLPVNHTVLGYIGNSDVLGEGETAFTLIGIINQLEQELLLCRLLLLWQLEALVPLQFDGAILM